MRILIVDDETRLQRALEMKLSITGFEVDVANDGAGAYKKIADDGYDLILLDLYMPEMDGKTLLHKLRNEETHKHLIYVISNHAVEEQKIITDNLADRYYFKPDIRLTDFITDIFNDTGGK